LKPNESGYAKKLATKKLRAIIFDIGRCWCGSTSPGMGGLAGTISLTPQETWAAIEHDPRWPRTGKKAACLRRDWQLHICRRLGVNLSFEQFSDIWNQVLDPTPLLGRLIS